MSLSPGTKLGPYEIVSAIGAGGMGEVYKARDTRLDRDVAIKVLPESFAKDTDRLRRFEQEARVISTLNHPNVLAIYDVGKSGDAPYLVAELLEGESLGHRLQSGPLPQRKAIETATQVACGLAAAHEKGIVHRDLKPDNIFLTEDGRVKILDFGLAKNLRPEAFSASASMATLDSPQVASPTAEGQVMGTVGYMSPEQVRGQAADHRSDIFSFGAILYEMLSGKRAFKKDSGVETMSAILNEDPPELTETNRNIAPGLERIVRHCLEKKPTQRFQSASDIAFDLETLSSHSSTSLGAAALKGARFNQKLAVPIAAVLILAALAVGYFVGRNSKEIKVTRFQQLTFQRSGLTAGRFADDGQTIIYSSRSHTDTREAVWTTRSDVLQGRALELYNARVAAVSSTGEMALLLDIGPQNESVGTLATLPISGGAPRELIQNVRSADYTPDGKNFAVVVRGEGEFRLEYPPGKVLHRFPGALSYVRFSPDGSKIAFSEHPVVFDSRGMVAVIDADGKNYKLLTPEYADITGIAWSPGSKEVWYGGSDSGISAALFAVSLSGKIRSIERSPGSLYLYDINKNGEVLVAHFSRRREAYAKGPGSDKIVDLSVFDYSIPAAISEDGRTTVLIEEGEGGGPKYSIFLRKTDGSPPVRLGEGVASAISLDGKWVAGGTITVPSPLILFPTGAGESRTFLNNGMDHQNAQFFRDGKRLFLTAREKGKGLRHWTMNMDGTGLRPITAENETGALSQDETSVVLIREGTVYMKNIESGEESRSRDTTPFRGMTFVGWSDKKGKAYFVSRENLVLTVWEADTEKGTKSPLHRVDASNSSGAIPLPGVVAITRDGKYFIYSADRRNSDLYLLKGAE
ncbi:MAG TPA: protein kinase [Terriglobales bacterium]|nr:protein kinase [Terriglobales bacterium]